MRAWWVNEKMMVVPFAWIVDFVLQNAGIFYRINKDEGDESLSLLTFQRNGANAIFLKYSKEGSLSLSHVGIRNVSSDVCYADTRHYQVSSEKQGRCKKCKKNSQYHYVKCKVNLHDIYSEIFHGY